MTFHRGTSFNQDDNDDLGQTTCPVCEGQGYVWVENDKTWRWFIIIPIKDNREYAQKRCSSCKGRGYL